MISCLNFDSLPLNRASLRRQFLISLPFLRNMRNDMNISHAVCVQWGRGVRTCNVWKYGKFGARGVDAEGFGS